MTKISLDLLNNISSDSFISEIILFVQKLAIHIFNFILYNVIYFTFSFGLIFKLCKSNFNSFMKSTIFNSFNY